jgi:hypothetical protein
MTKTQELVLIHRYLDDVLHSTELGVRTVFRRADGSEYVLWLTKRLPVRRCAEGIVAVAEVRAKTLRLRSP